MIKDLVLGIIALLITIAILFALVYIFIDKDQERCMSMPFNEMLEDESCGMYWEALDG